MAITLGPLSLSLDTRASLWLQLGRYSAYVTREATSGPTFVHRQDAGRFRSVEARFGRLCVVASAG